LLKHFLSRLGPAVISALNSKRLRDEHRQNEAQLKRFQDQIARALEEKEVLLKEIHHRVKNNLQVISSLLALQSEALADPRARDLLADSQNRVRAMAMIHEKLYQSPDLARVQFDEYVSSLAASLVRSHAHTDGAPELRTELDPVSLSINAAVPCGLILNELVSNALKHAFRDGRRGWIQVRLKIEPRGYSLTVADNGTGLPLGVDGGPSGSLGLQLVDMLARQLKATLTVGSVEGASFKLDFNDDGPKDHGQPSRT
jgi:two-component sensor histidine kinase